MESLSDNATKRISLPTISFCDETECIDLSNDSDESSSPEISPVPTGHIKADNITSELVSRNLNSAGVHSMIDLSKDDDDDMITNDSITTDKKRPDVVDDGESPRRSKRKKSSTVIYVGGDAVKKENNYVLCGHAYKFGGLEGSEKPMTKQKDVSIKTNQVPKPVRSMTQLEKDRLCFKEKIQSNIKAKAIVRQQFLRNHLPTMKPFLDSKIIGTIESWNESSPLTIASDIPMYMQPDSITADMRDYQLEGLNWMSMMYKNNVGMILGDEMGLGKTLQCVSLVCHLKEKWNVSGPSLIVCPLSVLYSWCNEIAKWAPSLKFLRFHSSNPESMELTNIGAYDMIVTTYEMAKSPFLRPLWSRQHFNLLVLDEGHRIKSVDTQVAQAVRKIHCENRLILTGTPLANNLTELWSLLNFLVPDVFTASEPFEEAFNLTLNTVDPLKLEQAHDLLRVFMLRRLKIEVEKLMPKKIETKVICPLSNMQIWWYKAMLIKDIGILARKDGKINAGVLTNLIMQLRKVCLHPFLFPNTEDIDSTSLEQLVAASGKLAVLDKLLCSLYKKNHRVVLFSQFTRVLDILDDYASMRGWKYCRFDGGTPRAQRNYIVNSFNAPGSDKFLFLMSTRSGGMGLNLQTADTCILFDSDWNPQPDIQAMARVHRIGQTRTVHVYRLVTEGTVEQRMVERAEKKLYLDRMVTRDGAVEETIDETADKSKLLATLKFGCNAVFGQNSMENRLPTDEDIEIITDRNRTEEFSAGNLKGGAESTMDSFDACFEFTKTTSFAGIDFQKIRLEYESKKLTTVADIYDSWKKRQRKSRILMVDGIGSGYGSSTVPVLASNDYDLQSGEKSVFQRELKGQYQTLIAQKKPRKGPAFDHQDFCQICGDGGSVVCCPRCPITVHLYCAGIRNVKHFLSCSHHNCTICGKNTTDSGGFIYPCQSCPNAFCEDHLPKGARVLESCERMKSLNYKPKKGVYVNCSKQCEQVAIQEFGWKPPELCPRPPCPPLLNVSHQFGAEIDDSLEAPDDVVVDMRLPSLEIEEVKENSSNHHSAPGDVIVEIRRPSLVKEKSSNHESATNDVVVDMRRPFLETEVLM